MLRSRQRLTTGKAAKEWSGQPWSAIGKTAEEWLVILSRSTMGKTAEEGSRQSRLTTGKTAEQGSGLSGGCGLAREFSLTTLKSEIGTLV